MAMQNQFFFSRLIKTVGSSSYFGKVFHGRPLTGMLKRYHDIPKYVENQEETENRGETEPFSLVMPRARRNLVYDRWRNVSFSPKLLGPGMIIFKNYLTLLGQVDIVNICQEKAMKSGGFYQPKDQFGTKLGLHMMCYGRNWDPVTRYEKHYRSDGSEPPPLPYELISLAENTIQDAQSHLDELPSMCPDICVARFLTLIHDQLGLHQDCDESSDTLTKGLPIVYVCIGNSVDFHYGYVKDENTPNHVMMKSGDVLIYGGKSRLIFHEVRRNLSDSTPEQLWQETRLRNGNLSLTLKQF